MMHESLDDMIAQTSVNSVKTTQGFRAVADQKDGNAKAGMFIELLGTTNLLRKASRRNFDVLALIRQYIDRHTKRGLDELAIKPECKKGCSFCCYQVVSVSDEEADELSHFLTDEMLDALAIQKKDIETHTEAERATFPSRLGRDQARCVFLQDGACSVYEKRPLMCRLVFSQKAKACDQFIKGGQKEPIPRVNIIPAEVMVTSYMQSNPMGPMPLKLLERI